MSELPLWFPRDEALLPPSIREGYLEGIDGVPQGTTLPFSEVLVLRIDRGGIARYWKPRTRKEVDSLMSVNNNLWALNHYNPIHKHRVIVKPSGRTSLQNMGNHCMITSAKNLAEMRNILYALANYEGGKQGDPSLDYSSEV